VDRQDVVVAPYRSSGVVEPCRRLRGGGTPSPTNTPGGMRCQAPTSRPGTARRTRLGGRSGPGSRAAAIYAGVDQPSPHRLRLTSCASPMSLRLSPRSVYKVGELGVRRTPTLRNRRATLDAEPGEAEEHEIGAAAQQFADLGTAATLLAVEPPDLIVVDVAARHHRAVATGHTGGDQPVVHRLGRNTELDRQSRDRLVVITYPVTSVATSGLPTARGITPSFPPRRLGGRCAEPCAAPPPGAAPAPLAPVRPQPSQGARPHSSHRSSPAAHPQPPRYQPSSQVRHGVRVNAKSYVTPQGHGPRRRWCGWGLRRLSHFDNSVRSSYPGLRC